MHTQYPTGGDSPRFNCPLRHVSRFYFATKSSKWDCDDGGGGRGSHGGPGGLSKCGSSEVFLRLQPEVCATAGSVYKLESSGMAIAATVFE